VAFVIEIDETPFTNNSNLFTVVLVIVHAKDILYQVPVDKVEPFVPICAPESLANIWSTPPLVIAIVGEVKAETGWSVVEKKEDVAFGKATIYK
jgi:hypothetical protein